MCPRQCLSGVGRTRRRGWARHPRTARIRSSRSYSMFMIYVEKYLQLACATHMCVCYATPARRTEPQAPTPKIQLNAVVKYVRAGAFARTSRDLPVTRHSVAARGHRRHPRAHWKRRLLADCCAVLRLTIDPALLAVRSESRLSLTYHSEDVLLYKALARLLGGHVLHWRQRR